MKCRIGYVSNSSSSSFILCYDVKPGFSYLSDDGYSTISIDDFILSLRMFQNDDPDSERTQVCSIGKHNSIAYIKERFWSYEDNLTDLVKKVKPFLDKYDKTVVIQISYDDDIVRHILSMFKKAGELIVLGYDGEKIVGNLKKE